MKNQHIEEEEETDIESEVEDDGSPPVEEPPVEVDVDAAADTVSGDQLRRLSASSTINRPDISRLPDALERGRPVFKAGDKIVIERYATILAGRPYLDTRTYRVIEMDDTTGRMRLYDEALCQFASDNWRTGSTAGSVYKLAMGVVVGTKKRRGRPRKAPVEAPPQAVPSPEVKRSRGRPKGSKNRSKDEIRAEKAEKRSASHLRAAKMKPRRRTSE